MNSILINTKIKVWFYIRICIFKCNIRKKAINVSLCNQFFDGDNISQIFPHAGPLILFNYSCQCLLIFLKVYLWGIGRNYVFGLLLNIPFNLDTLQLESCGHVLVSRDHMIVCSGHTLVSCGHTLH